MFLEMLFGEEDFLFHFADVLLVGDVGIQFVFDLGVFLLKLLVGDEVLFVLVSVHLGGDIFGAGTRTTKGRQGA